jgi:NAD-dependent deacetylase
MIPHDALIRSHQQVLAGLRRNAGNRDVGTVQPAATMPFIAKDSGAAIIEINPEPTSLTSHISDLTLLGAAGSIVPRLIKGDQRQRASA